MARRTRAVSGRLRVSLIALGTVLTWALWQPVLLGHKPHWLLFGAGRALNYVLLPAPLIIAFFISRPAGKKGWLQGGVTLAAGYVLTIPYNIWVESNLPTGFISYGATLFDRFFGIVTFSIAFFAVGALMGYAAGKTVKTRAKILNPTSVTQESQMQE